MPRAVDRERLCRLCDITQKLNRIKADFRRRSLSQVCLWQALDATSHSRRRLGGDVSNRCRSVFEARMSTSAPAKSEASFTLIDSRTGGFASHPPMTWRQAAGMCRRDSPQPRSAAPPKPVSTVLNDENTEHADSPVRCPRSTSVRQPLAQVSSGVVSPQPLVGLVRPCTCLRAAVSVRIRPVCSCHAAI